MLLFNVSAQTPPSSINELKASPQGTYIAIGYTDGRITLLDYDSQEEVELRAGGIDIYDVALFAWHPTENLLAAGDIGGKIEIWDVDAQQLLISFPSVTGSVVTGLEWFPNGEYLISGHSGQGRVIVWNMLSGDIETSISSLGEIYSMQFDADESRVFVGDIGRLSSWNIETGENQFILETGNHEASLSLSPDGRLLFSWSVNPSENTRSLNIWDVDTWILVRSLDEPLDVPTGGIRRSGWSVDGNLIYTASLLGYINVWDAHTGIFLRSIEYDGLIGGVDILPDDSQFVFGGLLNDGQSATVQYAPVPIFPTADAGPDQTLTADGSGFATVTLDGSASFDPDGEIVSYVWTLDGVEIATGVSPAVTLEVGEHVITLTVTDTDGASGMDSVVVTVLPLSGLMSAGIYNDNDSGLVYSGTWSVISSQHLFNGSATYTQTANDTMIFYVDGDTVNSVILYRTLDGTSLGSMRMQVEGRPRAGEASLVYVDRVVANNDVAGGFLTQAEAIVRIGPGIQKITVTNLEANLFTAIDAVELVGIQTVMTEPNTYNSHDGLIHFSLKWQDRTAVDSYGGNFKLNFEPNASAIFAIDGDGVVIYHSTNTDRRQVEICFTNEAHEEFCQVLNQYTGAQWLGTRTVVRAPTYDRYTVEIRNYRDANGEYGNFSIEGIEVLGIQQPLPPSTTMYQEENSQMRYTGLWHTRKSYWSLGTDIVELYDGSTASFLIDVDEVHTINFYYRGNAHYGMAQLCIDVCIPFDQNRPLRQDGELLVVPVSSLINTGTTGIATVVFSGTDADTRLVTIEAFELLGE